MKNNILYVGLDVDDKAFRGQWTENYLTLLLPAGFNNTWYFTLMGQFPKHKPR